MTNVDVRMHGDMDATSDLSGTAAAHISDRSRRRGQANLGREERCGTRGWSPYDMVEGVSARIANDGSTMIQVFISLPSFVCREALHATPMDMTGQGSERV